MSNTALAVVDVQNGFINENSRVVLPHCLRLIEFFEERGWPIFATQFINRPESGFQKWVKWKRLQESPEIDLVPELDNLGITCFRKHGYSSLTPEVRSWLKEKGVTRLVCCGVATESCVLKTAVDAFEADIEPIVITTASMSHAGLKAHDAGLFVLSRFIGSGQLRTLDEFLEHN